MNKHSAGPLQEPECQSFWDIHKDKHVRLDVHFSYTLHQEVEIKCRVFGAWTMMDKKM